MCGPDAVIRAVGTFANPNLLAAFLVLLLPLAAAGSAALADRPSRLLGTGVVAVGYAAVLLTASRGGVAAALAGVVAFLVLLRPSRRRLLMAAATAVLGAGLVVVASPRHGRRAGRHLGGRRAAGAHPSARCRAGAAGAALDAAIPGPEAFQHAHDLWLNVSLALWLVLGLLAAELRPGAQPASAARSRSGSR